MKSRRVFVLVTVLLVCLLSFMVACQSAKQEELTGPDTYVDNGQDKDPSYNVIDQPDTSNQDSSIKLKSIHYYTVNASTHTIRNSVTAVSQDFEISADSILDLIVDSLGDQSVNLVIDSVSYEGSRCIISFSDSIYAISEADTELEDLILDACAQSVLDNIDSCNSISYRISGGEYRTAGHSFSTDFDYMDD